MMQMFSEFLFVICFKQIWIHFYAVHFYCSTQVFTGNIVPKNNENEYSADSILERRGVFSGVLTQVPVGEGKTMNDSVKYLIY